MSSTPFVVLGAGPAGLGAAYRLASRGFEVVVLEQGSAVGGMAASFEVSGQQVDHGSHRLHAATPQPILEMLQSRLGSELQRRPRKGRIRLQGRWLSFPLKPSDLVRSLPPRFLFRAGLSAGVAALRPHRDGSFAEYVATGLGRTMGDAFYFPYARKIWGVDPAELSGNQAKRRISADSPLKLIRRVGAKQSSGGRFFYYPSGGFGRIPEVIADAAVESGADIRLGSGVERLEPGEHSVTITTTDGSRIEAQQVWSTIPLTRLAQLTEPADSDVLGSTASLEYRSMLLVYTTVATSQYTPFDAHYFPEADVAVTRISEPKNYRDGADPPSSTVLCAELPCAVSDPMWDWTDDQLGALVADSLAKAGLPKPAITNVVVRRIRHAYPIYRVDFESSLEAVLAWAAAQPRLVTFGRQGLFAHDNTHHALAMAWAAADAVDSSGRFDDTAWFRSLQDFASHTVED